MCANSVWFFMFVHLLYEGGSRCLGCFCLPLIFFYILEFEMHMVVLGFYPNLKAFERKGWKLTILNYQLEIQKSWKEDNLISVQSSKWSLTQKCQYCEQFKRLNYYIFSLSFHILFDIFSSWCSNTRALRRKVYDYSKKCYFT